MQDKYDMKTLRKIINKNKGKALSNTEITKQLDGKVKVYSYDELSKFPTIDALLEPVNIPESLSMEFYFVYEGE